jgi:RimJ/RimL family protein N-acetyltransferase
LFSLVNDIKQRGLHQPLDVMPASYFPDKFVENGFWEESEGTMVITDRADGRILGTVQFGKHLDYAEGYEVGIQIFKKSDRGKGFATEALKIFTSYLFELKNIPRLTACVFAGNDISEKLLNKCNFEYEGKMKKAYFLRGELQDIIIYGLMKEDTPKLLDLIQ